MAVVFSSKQVGRARDMLATLSGSLRTARFYPASHPAVAGLVAELFAVVSEYHGEGVDVPLTFYEGELLLGEQLLTEESLAFDQLIRDMTSTGVGSLTLLRDLTPEELVRAIVVLAMDPAKIPEQGGIDELLARADVPHVLVGAVTVSERVESVEPGQEREMARNSYNSAVDLLRELERAIRLSQPVSSSRVKGVVHGLIEGVLSNRYAMLELSGLKSYDEYTFFHSVNVAILSLALGATVSHDRRFLGSLGVGALMHDIGKTDIEVSVLNKPGALTAEEWALVRKHPVYGAEVAAKLPGLDKSAVVVILEHHMRFDLNGYPQLPVMAEHQHLGSRIVAIADAYDAMTSRRSYSPARLQDEAMSVLVRNMSTGFDPVLVKLFVNMLGVYPPRSVVRLTSGETAVVIRPNATDVTRPVVRVFADANANVLEPYELDLCALAPEDQREIASCLDASGLNVDIDDFLN
jgi:HD-GYP domain-containing protein (c-di-GMP phosphodiesterase class II)